MSSVTHLENAPSLQAGTKLFPILYNVDELKRPKAASYAWLKS
jgi:hypothetical protein